MMNISKGHNILTLDKQFKNILNYFILFLKLIVVEHFDGKAKE